MTKIDTIGRRFNELVAEGDELMASNAQQTTVEMSDKAVCLAWCLLR
jgi:hypothetical protein